MTDLLVIVPSRGRPESVARVVQAWADTGAYDDGARLVFAVDDDDPRRDAYYGAQHAAGPDRWRPLVQFAACGPWQPMVPKLNQAAVFAAGWPDAPYAVGFAGDDHLPRTSGWARRYIETLRELGSGIVYGDDGLQAARLPTQWAMTADIIRAVGAMVPAPVEHLYCDNAVKDLGDAAGCIRYLPDVLIEHMHPLAGKAALDDGYRRVNAERQYARDGAAYRQWREQRLPGDVRAVLALRQPASA